MQKGFFGMVYRILCFKKNSLFICYVSKEQLTLFKKNKKKYFVLGKTTLSLKQQLEIFEFLSLYYSDGENVYGLLLKYQQFVAKKTKRISKFILSELRKGKEFSDVLMESKLFNEEICSFLMIARLAGISSQNFQEIVEQLRLKQKKQNETIKKSLYPALLLFAGLGMMVFVSYSIIPNFLFFFQDSGQEIPLIFKILSKEHLWKVGALLFVITLVMLLIFRTIPIKVKVKLPVVKVFLKSQFQLLFWRLCLISAQNGMPLDELITDHLTRQKKGFVVYYLSTIVSRIKRGFSLEQAIDISLIDKKQRVLTSMSTDSERKKQLYQNFLREAEQQYDRVQVITANLISGIALLIMGIIILLLGYVMLIPLSQISNVI